MSGHEDPGPYWCLWAHPETLKYTNSRVVAGLEIKQG